ELTPNKGLKKVYTKRLLPNYDIFDEQKYFTKGHENFFYQFEGKTFGLLICEDMWPSNFHDVDPCQMMIDEIKERNIQMDGVINLSASPFDLEKQNKRIERAKQLSKLFQAPFIYINRVGGEDEILFDGSSFIVNNNDLILELKAFEAESKSIRLPAKLHNYDSYQPHQKILWESLFQPSL